MADETGGGGGDVSVGALIVDLEGDGGDFSDAIDEAVAKMQKLESVTKLAGTAIDALNARQMATINIQTTQAAARGAYTATQAAVQQNATYGPAVKPRFDLQEQDIRNRMAEIIRNTREQANEARIELEVRTRLYGAPGTDQGLGYEGDAGGLDSYGPAVRDRFNNQERAVRERSANVLRDIRAQKEEVRVAEESQQQNLLHILEAEQPGEEIAPGSKRSRNGGGKGGGEEEEGGISAYLIRRLAFHGGQALGQAGLGSEAGLLTLLAETFGPTGLLVAGGVAFGAVLGQVYGKQWELKEAAIAYTNTLKAANREWTVMGHAVSMTSANAKQAMQEAAKDREESFNEIQQYQEKIRNMGVMEAAGIAGDAFLHGGMKGTAAQGEFDQLQRHVEQRKLTAQIEKDAAVQMEAAERQREATQRSLAQGTAAVGAMQPGSRAQERAGMNLQIATAEQNIRDEQARKKEQLDKAELLATETAARASFEANKKLHPNDTTPFAMPITSPTQSDAQVALAKETADKLALQNIIAGEQRKAQQQKEDQEERQAQFAGMTSLVAATNVGYQAQHALLVESGRQRISEAVRTGKNEVEVRRTVANEIFTMERDHTHEVAETMQDLTDRMNAAVPAANTLAAEVDKAGRAAAWSWAGSKEELKKYLDMLPKVLQAEADRTNAMAVQTAAIEAQRFSRQITERERLIAEAKLNDPKTDPTARVDAERANATAKFAREQLATIHNAKGLANVMAEYVTQLREAVLLGEKNGGLSIEQAKMALAFKAQELGLSGYYNNGSFKSQDRGAGGAGGAGHFIDLAHYNILQQKGGVEVKEDANHQIFVSMGQVLNGIWHQITREPLN